MHYSTEIRGKTANQTVFFSSLLSPLGFVFYESQQSFYAPRGSCSLPSSWRFWHNVQQSTGHSYEQLLIFFCDRCSLEVLYISSTRSAGLCAGLQNWRPERGRYSFGLRKYSCGQPWTLSCLIEKPLLLHPSDSVGTRYPNPSDPRNRSGIVHKQTR